MTTSASTPILFAAALLAGATLFSPGASAQPADISIQTAQGEVRVPQNPETVLVLDITSLDTLAALDVEVDGVPAAAYPDYLSKYSGDAYAKIGSLHEPDLEAVNAAEPDLIIIGGRSRLHLEALSAIAPTIDMSVDPARFVESAETRALDLGRIFGKEAQAQALIDDLDASIAALNEKSAVVERGLIVLTTGNKMSAYGPGSRFGVLHTEYGVKPVREDLDAAIHGEAISFEFIAEANPDWLFVVDRDAAIGRGAAAAMLDNALVGRTDAWKNGNVVYLEPGNWYLVGGGLQAMRQNVEQLSAAFDAKD